MHIDRYSLIALAAVCCLAVGCGDDDTVTVVDAGPDSGAKQDAGTKHDAGMHDAGMHDAGMHDAAIEEDAGAEEDAGVATSGLTIPTSFRKVTVVAVEYKLTPSRIVAKKS